MGALGQGLFAVRATQFFLVSRTILASVVAFCPRELSFLGYAGFVEPGARSSRKIKEEVQGG